MKSFFKATSLVLVICALYLAWVLKITYCGTKIANYKKDGFEVRIVRMPFKFSVFTPLYGKYMFSGYVRTSIHSGATELTSFSVYGDSHYPRSANITIENYDSFDIELEYGPSLNCTIRNSQAIWKKKGA